MLTQDQIQALKAPFPPESLSSDTSRGFELTSIKAAYVIERLNEVFGPCGIGWRYVHSPLEELYTDSGRVEFVTEVALQYRFKASNGCTGCDQVMWDTQANNWAFRTGGSNHDWSEPIFACGGHGLGKGSAPLTDARKSAVTDGLTKAASMIGVGHEVFKGLVLARDGNDHTQTGSGGNGRKRAAGGSGNGKDQRPDANAFWTLYNTSGKQAGVSVEAAKVLANKGDWAAACSELHTLIAEVTS